jgi:tol-pal system protein YbgF
MKFIRLATAALVFSSMTFAASKEMVELQRDVALLQDKVDTMQRDLDTKLGELTAMMHQVQDNSARSNAQLQDTLTNGVTKQLAPIVGVGTRVDSMGDDVRALRDSVNDLNARLERMDGKITDLKNQMQIIQNPPPAPGTVPTTGVPGAVGAPTGVAGQPQAAAGPPAGMSLDKTYTDARRDQQQGNVDLAAQEYHQILQYYPDSELAANAQYYIGEIAYNKGDMASAIQSFDAVLERYPQNPKTPDAHLMKGMALEKSGQRTRAVQEYKALVEQFPRTDDARKAQLHLHALGVSVASTSTRRR